MKTTERLALALEKAGAPKLMIENARAGRYDDFQSESATPIRDLVTDLQFNGLHALAQDAIKGKFDATTEEAHAWYEQEGKGTIS